MATNWLPTDQVRVLAKKRVYLDSVGEIAPHTRVHETVAAVAGAPDGAATAIKEHLLQVGSDDPVIVAREPRTKHVKHCSITITPKMVLRRLGCLSFTK